MLKCVVFSVSAYFYDKLLQNKVQIAGELAKGNAELILLKARAIEENGKLLPQKELSKSSLEKMVQKGQYEKEELLFITDKERLFSGLMAYGFYALPLYHEKNREQFFSGAVYAIEDVGQLDFLSYEKAYRRLAGLPWDILETERLLVRESTVADVEDFYRIYSSPSITRYMEPLFQNPREEEAYTESYIKNIYGFYGFGMWSVVLKETGAVIGRAGLNVREGYELPELGFVIEEKRQQRGYAYEACMAILAYAKEELAFEEIQALVQEKNTASRHLLKKLGFRYRKMVKEDGQKYQFMIKQL